MPTSVRRDDKLRRRPGALGRLHVDPSLVAVVALPITVVALALFLPPVLILPAVAVLAIGAGFALEGARLLSRGYDGAVRVKEYAAGLVFAGLAASVLGDPDGAVLALSELAGAGGAKEAGGDR